MKQLNWYQIFGKSNIPDGRTVEPTDDIQIWLHCANIWDKSYTTLAEVLADTDTLLALISSNNAVDYMVRSTTWAVAQALVPIMTDNTHPSGVCYANSVYSASYEAWKAFDGDNATGWSGVGSGSATVGQYIYYQFTAPVVAKKLIVWQGRPYTNKVQGSVDGVTWDDITTYNSANGGGSYVENDVDISNNNTAYLFYRIMCQSNTGSYGYGAGTIQFYSASITADATAMTYIGQNNYCANTLLADATWCNAICNSEYFESVLNVKVPTMTSDTTPSGECISSGANQASEANYKAFDGDANTLFSSSGSGTGAGLYLGYIFDAPTKVYLVKAVHRANTTSAVTMNFKYQSKTSDGDWRDISETFNVSINNNTPTTMTAVSSGSDDVSYRIYRNSASIATRLGMWTLQFYGREDV